VKEKLVIGEIGDSFYPVMDGVAGVLKNYTEQMLGLGHTAYAVVPGYGKESAEYDREHGIDYTIRGRNFSPLKALKPYGIVIFPERVNRIPFDIVHSHSPFFAGQKTLNIAKRRNIPVISTFHTFFKDDLAEIVKDRVIDDFAVRQVMKYYSRIDEVWAPSEGAKLKITGEYFFDKPVRVVENGCDMPIPTDAQLARFREKGFETAGLNPGSKFFIYVGQHKDQKNLMLILESVKTLFDRGEDFYMIFVGDGHKKAEYEKFAADNRIDDRVRFLGRISERDKLKWLYSAACAFLFPSLYDTSCLVMREGAAFRLPLVYVEGACTSEGREDGVDGFIAGRTVEEFAGKLKYILDNPGARDAAGEGARKRIYRSWKDVGIEVQELYYNAIENKKRSRNQ